VYKVYISGKVDILLFGLNVNTYLWNMCEEQVSPHKRRAYVSDVIVSQCEDVLFHHICMHTMVGTHPPWQFALHNFQHALLLGNMQQMPGALLAEIEIEELLKTILSSECWILTAGTLPCGVCTLAKCFLNCLLCSIVTISSGLV